MIDPVEQDIKTHGIQETKNGRWYKRNYPDALEMVKRNYTHFHGVMIGYFSEEYGDVDEEWLRDLHKAFNEPLYYPATENDLSFYKKWVEECEEAADIWLKEY